MLILNASAIQNPVRDGHSQVRLGEFRGTGSRSALDLTPRARDASPCFTCSRSRRPMVTQKVANKTTAKHPGRDYHISRMHVIRLAKSPHPWLDDNNPQIGRQHHDNNSISPIQSDRTRRLQDSTRRGAASQVPSRWRMREATGGGVECSTLISPTL